MARHRLDLGAVTIEAEPTWVDITEGEDGENPLALAKEDGVGSLQFSYALYREGPEPRASTQDLREMLLEFAKVRGLGNPVDLVVGQADSSYAAASFRAGDDFFRVWYLSDGLSFCLVTYVSEWGRESEELLEVEEMIGTVRFDGTSNQAVRSQGVSRPR